MSAAARILVIKLGALGDFVQAMGPAAAIRAHHQDARIVLLTGAPFAALARDAPYFDEVWVDPRPSWARPWTVWTLARMLNRGGFARAYDLQTSDRSSGYFLLMRPRPEWSGIARGASHPHVNPARDRMHTLDRQADQLRMAGIAAVPPPDLAWARTDLKGFELPARFILLAPGGAPHRPEKRWPEARYAALAGLALKRGLVPLIVGGPAETTLAAAIAAAAPGARDLAGKTGFGDLVALGARASHAVGNDTGPMHLIVAGGAPATILYSAASDPALTAPRGRVAILRRRDLAELGVDEVAATLAGPL